MKKQYFSTRKRDNTLFRIVIAVCLILISAYGLYRLFWLSPVSAPGREGVSNIIKDKILQNREAPREEQWDKILKLREEKKFEELRQLLKSYVESTNDSDELAKAYLLWLEVEEEAGNLSHTEEVANQAQEKCVQAKDYVLILYKKACLLEKLNKG